MPPRLGPPSCRIRIHARPFFLPSFAARAFHTTRSPLFPNPYSKRPAEFPQPRDVPPRPPKTDKEHGLYGFFRMKKSLSLYTDPDHDALHGRSWTAEELRQKSWNDLHILWYKCVMERNIIATERLEARKQDVNFYYRDHHPKRVADIKRTMSRIKFVLWERYRAWWQAFQLNEQDPLLVDRIKLVEAEAEEARLAGMTVRQRRREQKLKEAKEREEQAKKKREEERKKAMKELEELKRLQAEEDAKLMAQFQQMAGGDGLEQKK